MDLISNAVADATKKQIPVAEGLFYIPSSPDEKPHLIGSRCRECGEVFFPATDMCANCCVMNMEKIALSRRGKLDTFTDVNYAQQWSKEPVPYCVGAVDLPDGVRINSVLVDCAVGELHRGKEVELVLAKLYEDENGNDVITFKFRPVK